MMNEDIMLSFFELTNSDFTIPVYRKAYDAEDNIENVYKYCLPAIDGIDKDTYIVSFIERENLSKYNASSFSNINMTKKWLAKSLIQKATEVFSPSSFILGKHFVPNISFIVSTYKEGQCLIQVEPYYLETKNCFGFLCDYKFRPFPGYEKARQEKVYSLALATDGSKNKNFYSDKLRYINKFIENFIPSLFPITLDNIVLDVKRSLTNLPSFLLNEKTYVFKNGESKIQFQGIKEYKPLKNDVGSPLYVFVFEQSKVNTSRQLVKALRGEEYSTFTGMQDMFGVALLNDNITSIIVNDYSIDSLKSIREQLDKIVEDNPNANIVGIFAGIKKDFDTENNYSPYYTVKSYFLKHGLAIQAVTIEQAIKKDGFKWSISSIALQLFVKLGGVPWKVKPQNENCLIFGISSAHIFDEDKNITRYFAYSLCFDSSGQYKRLSILGQSNDRTSYITQLTDQIKKHFQEDIDDSLEKCVIHVPFKLKQDEMRCIKNCIEAAKHDHQSIAFYVIKINVINKFFGYSHFNSNIPLAGSCVKLGDGEYLMWFEGLQQGKTQIVSAQNISNPVHIKFIYGSNLTEQETKSYLQDIINLSGANWRGFNAKHEPVSTLYPELIAKFAGKFDKYDIDLDIGDSAMNKAWFI